MRVNPEFRLQLLHKNTWINIGYAWELSSLSNQINFYEKRKLTFRVQRLINGQYK